MDRRDLPQIGPIDVEPESVSAAGEPLHGLLVRLGASASPEVVDSAPDAPRPPADGWRVLHTDRRLVVGAPLDAGRGSWSIAHLDPPSPDLPGGRIHHHPDPQPLRPSRTERGRGLELRWPESTRSAPDLEHLWIDVWNEGDERWRPNGDGFHVAASICRPGSESVSFAFVAGRDGACPLDPGEYARVRAHVDLSGLDGLEAGDHEVHAWLVDLSIRTAEPLHVQVTEDLLERRRAELAARPSRPPRSTQIEQQRHRVELLQALVAARERLPEIVEILVGPPDDRVSTRGRIAALLGCSEEAARLVFETSLRRFDRQEHDRIKLELRELERGLEHPTDSDD